MSQTKGNSENNNLFKIRNFDWDYFMPRCYLKGTDNSHAVATSAPNTGFSEREVAVLCHLVRTFLRMSKQSRFIRQKIIYLLKYNICQPFWTLDRLLTTIKKNL
jgi:hypothetical protein